MLFYDYDYFSLPYWIACWCNFPDQENCEDLKLHNGLYEYKNLLFRQASKNPRNEFHWKELYNIHIFEKEMYLYSACTY